MSYKTTLKDVKSRIQLTGAIAFEIYSTGGQLEQVAHSTGIYGCNGQIFRATDGREYGTTDIYNGWSHAGNCRLRDYCKENGLTFTDKWGTEYPR